MDVAGEVGSSLLWSGGLVELKHVGRRGFVVWSPEAEESHQCREVAPEDEGEEGGGSEEEV